MTIHFLYVILVNVSEVSTRLNEKFGKDCAKSITNIAIFSEVENLTVEIASSTSRDNSLKIKVLALSASDSGSSPDCRIITSQVET